MPFAIRKALINDADEVSSLIIKSVDFFHAKNYTDEELAYMEERLLSKRSKNSNFETL